MHASAKRRGEELRETRQQHKMEPRCHVLQARSEVVEVNRPLFSTNRGPQQVTEPCEPVWKGCSHETGRIPRIPLLRFDHGLPLLPFSDLRGQRFTELLSVRVSLYYACSVLLKWRLLRDCCYKQITLLTILPLKISFIFCELCAPLSKKGPVLRLSLACFSKITHCTFKKRSAWRLGCSGCSGKSNGFFRGAALYPLNSTGEDNCLCAVRPG